MRRKKSSKSAAGSGLSVLSLSEKTGITRETITKKLKKAGLYPPGDFPPSDVLAAIEPDQKEDSPIREKKTFEEWRKLKLRNDRDEALQVEVSKVAAWLSQIESDARGVLEQMLCNELPALVENLPADAIRFRAKKVFDRVCDKLKPLGQKYAAKTR